MCLHAPGRRFPSPCRHCRPPSSTASALCRDARGGWTGALSTTPAACGGTLVQPHSVPPPAAITAAVADIHWAAATQLRCTLPTAHAPPLRRQRTRPWRPRRQLPLPQVRPAAFCHPVSALAAEAAAATKGDGGAAHEAGWRCPRACRGHNRRTADSPGTLLRIPKSGASLHYTAAGTSRWQWQPPSKWRLWRLQDASTAR